MFVMEEECVYSETLTACLDTLQMSFIIYNYFLVALHTPTTMQTTNIPFSWLCVFLTTFFSCFEGLEYPQQLAYKTAYITGNNFHHSLYSLDEYFKYNTN
jgi:hypothetical protein